MEAFAQPGDPDGRVVRAVSALRPGDHLCSFYETRAHQMAVAVPFIRGGLTRGERCVYIADDASLSEVNAFLEEGGIDVAHETSRGALVVGTKRDAYLKTGSFSPESMIDFWGETVAQAKADGFRALRATGEGTVALGHEPGLDRFIEYEASLVDFFSSNPVIALCQYNAARFEPAFLIDILRTHPTAILGDRICPNLYFEPTRIALDRSPSREKLAWMISQLERARAAEESLETAIQMRREFLCLAAHELRTPLTALSLAAHNVDGCARRCAAEHRVECPAPFFAETIERQCRRLDDLVSKLLDGARAELGRIELHRVCVNLAALADRVVRDNQAEFAAEGYDVTLIAPEPVWGEWDATRIEQVIVNLLSNAKRYGDKRPIVVTVDKEDGLARLSVADRGVGIAPTFHARIFEMFGRAHGAAEFGGLGLGLYIVKQIVEAHGGAIRVASAPGHGSTFTVELPLAPN